jgi:hypothetical protein
MDWCAKINRIKTNYDSCITDARRETYIGNDDLSGEYSFDIVAALLIR